MSEYRTDSRIASLGAKAIYHGFDEYQRTFNAITSEAKTRFEQQDWAGIQANAVARLEVYTSEIQQLVVDVRALLGERITNTVVWAGMKAVYSSLIAERDDWEIAETFFNSVTRRIFVTVGVNQQIEFISTDFETPQTTASEPVYRSYQPHNALELVQTILHEYAFAVPYAALEHDTQTVAALIDEHLTGLGLTLETSRVDVVRAVFYRNKGAYIIGRIVSGEQIVPLALALLHHQHHGIVVDAVLLLEREISMLFSFTRSYFHVAVERPYDLVQFLASLMPHKRIAELYTAIGFHKHGKTELYRDFLRHLALSDDQFEIARGERGMVMTVFTLPSFDVVFKIIKDRFAPPKDTTRQAVMGKYHLVFKHDRAGRLVDAQEFEYLEIARHRFSPALLEELLRVAPSSVSANDDHVIIKHAYVERRVAPLDVYLREAEDTAAQAATLDFGKAIKDLAASNIFPGDMLLKNFGVTRNGRVVFYDYDELCLLTQCFFKQIPSSGDYDDDMAAEPWFAVGEYDVFPEEFAHFLGLRAPLRQLFIQVHGDLLAIPFWQAMQDAINDGEIVDIFPYSHSKRLPH